MGNSRTVYSTESGRVCPKCGWPANNCQCSKKSEGSDPVPDRIVAKLRIEKSGRGGKTVTVVYDLPRNAEFLKTLSSELKRACGVGGTVREDAVEVQGDVRDRVKEFLIKKGYAVKGA